MIRPKISDNDSFIFPKATSNDYNGKVALHLNFNHETKKNYHRKVR